LLVAATSAAAYSMQLEGCSCSGRASLPALAPPALRRGIHQRCPRALPWCPTASPASSAVALAQALCRDVCQRRRKALSLRLPTPPASSIVAPARALRTRATSELCCGDGPHALSWCLPALPASSCVHPRGLPRHPRNERTCAAGKLCRGVRQRRRRALLWRPRSARTHTVSRLMPLHAHTGPCERNASSRPLISRQLQTSSATS
jgi:hypothetical protein